MRKDKTKQDMGECLKTLMAQKPLNKITIKEITDACGLNRQAFYYHFTDIYALVRWVYQEEASRLIAEHDSFLTWEDGVMQLFHYVDENRAACRCLIESVEHGQLKSFMYKDIHSVVDAFVRSLPESATADAEKREFVTHFYTLAFASLAEDWVLDDSPNRKSAEELVGLISSTLFGHIADALRQA